MVTNVSGTRASGIQMITVDYHQVESHCFNTGLVTAARAGVRTDLAVYHAELEQQNLLLQLVNFQGRSQKGN